MTAAHGSVLERRAASESLCRPRHRCRAVPVRSLKEGIAPSGHILCAKGQPLTRNHFGLGQPWAHFDVASSGEIDICLGLKVSPERLFEPRGKAKHVGAGYSPLGASK
jgi:hypothetical protein